MSETATYVWADTYTRAVHAFDGQTPGRDLEQNLIAIFSERPAAVETAIDKLAARFTEGKIRSPWPLLLKELEQHDRAAVVANARSEQAAAVRLAETWIRNAGLYAPLTEVELEFFTHGGRLQPWADDEDLRERITDLWHHEQPRAEQAEADRIERATRWLAARAALRAPHEPESHPNEAAAEHAIRAELWQHDDPAAALLERWPSLPIDVLRRLSDLAATIAAEETGTTA